MKKYLMAGLLAVSLAAAGSTWVMAEENAQGTVFQMDQENFEEIVLADNDICTVKITGIEEDELWGYTWKAFVENKSDKNLMISFDGVSVNGFMCDPFWGTEVSAGMKDNSDISWFTEELDRNGITTVDEVVFTLRVTDSDDWFADPYLETACTVSSPSGNTQPEVVIDENAQVVIDNDELFFCITDIVEDDIWGYTWNVYIENRTDKRIACSMDDVCVNGFVCDPFWAIDITPGMKANSSVNWMEDNFVKNGIEEVTEVDFLLRYYDNSDLFSDSLFEETLSVYPMGEEAVKVYERVPAENEVVLVDNEYFTMIATGFGRDDFMSYCMEVYMENKTDHRLVISLEDATVNGYMCDPFWGSSIPAGKRSNTSIEWFESTLEENAITEIETITGKVSVMDDVTYESCASEMIEIQPWE